MNKLGKIVKSATSYIRVVIKDFFRQNLPSYSENYVVVLNTEIGSNNLGDCVIMKHCRKALEELFPSCEFYEVASHLPASSKDIDKMMKAKAVIVCGTNFLSSRMELTSVWKFIDEMQYIPNLILMGVGVSGYAKFSPYTKFYLKHLLKNDFVHSVRDEYSLKKLNSIGICNVLNTNCVTLWSIEQLCKFIPETKSENVVFTITGYYHDILHDTVLIDILKRNYKTLYFWPQGDTDLNYLQANFDVKDIVILERTIEAYEECLKQPDIDYVGSRLHGGIHAIYHKKRTIILSVDNRAREIGKDTNVPVLEMESIESELENKIRGTWKTEIHVNNEVINQWKCELKKKFS